MKKLACLFLSMGLAVGLTAAASAETVLRFATDSSEDYVSTVQIYKFADEVKEKTDGRITVRFMPVVSSVRKRSASNRCRWVLWILPSLPWAR